MSLEVEIEDETDIIRDELGRIMTRIPEVEEELAEEMMEIAVEEILVSAQKQFNDFSGNLRNQINMKNVRKVNTGDGVKLTLPLKGNTPRDADYLEWHENADSGHFVEVSKDNAPIQDWVERNYDGNRKPSYLYVEPTPFVKPAVQRIARRMRNKASGDNNAVAELAKEVK